MRISSQYKQIKTKRKMPNAFTRQLPNAVTCCNLLCGCAATGAAFYGHLHWAVIMIICGAVFDFFDGLTARVLGVSSPIGKELDSLADCVTFGVAPSAILFWVMHEVHCPEVLMPLKDILPYSAFLLATFSALRLAKFNACQVSSLNLSAIMGTSHTSR